MACVQSEAHWDRIPTFQGVGSGGKDEGQRVGGAKLQAMLVLCNMCQHLQRGQQWKPLHYLGVSIRHPLKVQVVVLFVCFSRPGFSWNLAMFNSRSHELELPILRVGSWDSNDPIGGGFHCGSAGQRHPVRKRHGDSKGTQLPTLFTVVIRAIHLATSERCRSDRGMHPKRLDRRRMSTSLPHAAHERFLIPAASLKGFWTILDPKTPFSNMICLLPDSFLLPLTG